MRNERVAIERIRIQRRVREDLGDLETLKKSIQEYGLINPILLDAQYNLIAGERRLRAVQSLGWPQIDTRILNSAGQVALFDLEVHENLLRKAFTEQEVTKSIEWKKRLLDPPWYIRFLNCLIRLKQRIFRG